MVQSVVRAIDATQTDTNQLGGRLRALRAEKGFSQATLAEAIQKERQKTDPNGKCSRGAVTAWESGNAYPEYRTTLTIARVLRSTPEYIAYGVGDKEVRVSSIAPEFDTLAFVNEVEFGDEITDRKKIRSWGVPRDLLNHVSKDNDENIIMRLNSSVLSPEYVSGDRVYVDTEDTKPSGGGSFAYWDGRGAAFAHIHAVPGQDTMLSLSGEGLNMAVKTKDIIIIGRIKGRFSLG